jgi:hypothetical protein
MGEDYGGRAPALASESRWLRKAFELVYEIFLEEGLIKLNVLDDLRRSLPKRVAAELPRAQVESPADALRRDFGWLTRSESRWPLFGVWLESAEQRVVGASAKVRIHTVRQTVERVANSRQQGGFTLRTDEIEIPFVFVPTTLLTWGDAGEVVSGFYIAKTVTTNAQYRPFRRRNKLQPPYERLDRRIANDDGRPAVGVDWQGALEFCRHLSAFSAEQLGDGWTVGLPTEREWEIAALGRNPTLEAHLNTQPGELWTDGIAPVVKTSGSGRSDFGTFGQCGGLFEWTDDAWTPEHRNLVNASQSDYDPQSPENPGMLRFDPIAREATPFKVARGGSWWAADRSAHSRRNRFASGYRGPTLGFRMVLVSRMSPQHAPRPAPTQ